MDLSVQALREVTFAPKRNGYDPAGVDDFIDDVVAGYEELENKLKEAHERVSAAEARAAAAVDAAPPPPISATDIGKIWERAAAGAEETMEAARNEASKILDEARNNAALAEAAVEEAQADAVKIRVDADEAARAAHEQAVQSARAESDNIIRAARNDAEQTRNAAVEEAQGLISTTRNEAARLAEQAQGQLRDEVSQLESARNELRRQVEELTAHIETEIGRARETLGGAMDVINSTQVGVNDIPQTPPVEIPEARYAQGAEAFGAVAGFSAAAADVVDRGAAPFSEPARETDPGRESDEGLNFVGEGLPAYSAPESEPQSLQQDEEPPTSAFERLEVDSGQTGNDTEASPSVTASEDIATTEEQPSAWELMARSDASPTGDKVPVAPWEQQGFGDIGNLRDSSSSTRDADNVVDATDDEDDKDFDPFLAELRRAVHDEGPLGPRNADDDEASIDNLYADTDDDNEGRGFFRRRK